MRTSLTSRAAVAIATLSIGSAALAAAPATAATPSGITREMVLTAAAGVRSAPSGTIDYNETTRRALKALANRACAIDPDGSEIYLAGLAGATAPGAGADGVVVTAVLSTSDISEGANPTRICTFGALTATSGQSTLSGTATVGGASYALSGDVFATPGVRTELTGAPSAAAVFPAFAASGNAVQSITVKVKDKKTSKEKKAAKKTYAKRLQAAKKTYARALDKAGSSKARKTAAKKAYKAKVRTVRAAYRYAIASYRLRTVKVPTAFSISAQATPPS